MSKLDFPATRRNQGAIAQVLASFLEPSREQKLLELASGSGQHVVSFAKTFPQWNFQPSDVEQAHLESIEAYRADLTSSNVAPAIPLDVAETPWPVPHSMDVILAINLIHISPWRCTLSIFEEGRKHLVAGGSIYLYGAFFQDDVVTAPSNLAFDAGLRARNSDWGVRRLEDVRQVAESQGFVLAHRQEMPANNLSLFWRLT